MSERNKANRNASKSNALSIYDDVNCGECTGDGCGSVIAGVTVTVDANSINFQGTSDPGTDTITNEMVYLDQDGHDTTSVELDEDGVGEVANGTGLDTQIPLRIRYKVWTEGGCIKEAFATMPAPWSLDGNTTQIGGLFVPEEE